MTLEHSIEKWSKEDRGKDFLSALSKWVEREGLAEMDSWKGFSHRIKHDFTIW